MVERCPTEVQKQLLEILRWGILNIRSGSESNDCGICGIEANHIHNIPGLIERFSRDRLAYYLNVEAAQYAREIGPQIPLPLRTAWDVLNEWLRKV